MQAKDVLDILYYALRRAIDNRINDVETDTGADGQDQLVITTDDGENKQVWILDDISILESPE